MTTDEILSDLEDERDRNDLNSALIEDLQGLITDQNDELAALRDAIESLSLLWTTLRTAARAVVEQVAVEDREGAGWHGGDAGECAAVGCCERGGGAEAMTDRAKYMATWRRVTTKPNCGRRRRRDPDEVGRCLLCRGPIYFDEIPIDGWLRTRCPDCRATLRQIQDANHRLQARETIATDFGRTDHRTETYRATVGTEEALISLHGLQWTEADMRELERRRTMLGLRLAR